MANRTTQAAAPAAPVYAKQAFDGFFQGFTTDEGSQYFRGGIHLPNADGTLTLAFLSNRGTGSKLRFNIEVEWENYGVIEFEPVKGWNAKRPEKTKNRCLQGNVVDANGEIQSAVVVFQNSRKDGSGFVYGISPHKPKEEGTNTCDSFF